MRHMRACRVDRKGEETYALNRPSIDTPPTPSLHLSPTTPHHTHTFITVRYLCPKIVEADQHVRAAPLRGQLQAIEKHVQLGTQGMAQPEDGELFFGDVMGRFSTVLFRVDRLVVCVVCGG